MDYIYKIDTNGGYNSISITVCPSNIYIYVNGSNYNVSATNRKAVSSGQVVNKIWKKKIWSGLSYTKLVDKLHRQWLFAFYKELVMDFIQNGCGKRSICCKLLNDC
jgi:hypothetical protein